MNRKIDIRIWCVVSKWNPLKIYWYKECYIRFGCNDYDPTNPSNIYSHLTNNTVTAKCMRRIDNVKIIDKVNKFAHRLPQTVFQKTKIALIQ